ncbi:hypothetical protein Tco_1019117 [Tanacetum coccineum]|uniref:Uncharacterized protein n=1 Tax=Tanacetum coccineum TaxID=301880 RepID=A0ABQ5FWB0_9ASTR
MALFPRLSIWVRQTQFMEFFDSKEVNASDFPNKCWQKSFSDGAKWEPEAYRCLLLRDFYSVKKLDKFIKKKRDTTTRELAFGGYYIGSRCFGHRSGVVNRSLFVTDVARLEACWVNEGSRIDMIYGCLGKAVGQIVSKIVVQRIHSAVHWEMKNRCSLFSSAYESNSFIDITSAIPNMDSDRGKEEHDDVNSEAQQVNALLTNELERYKEKEKHFAKDMIIDSEYCKKIKLLNDEISNLKSQACEKDKTFAKENEKYDEYGLDFENQNDNVNPSALNKSKELAPCLYNVDEMGKDELSDHKIIFEEELKCEAAKRLKVKQIKSPFSYHGFVYADEEPPKIPLKRKSGEKKILFENDTSIFKTKIKELEMTLAQQTKDFKDAKVDFSKKTDKFETYFEKLEKIKVVLERQLDRKIQDSNAEKDKFLKQIASLESKLASQDLISNQKEYSDLTQHSNGFQNS